MAELMDNEEVIDEFRHEIDTLVYEYKGKLSPRVMAKELNEYRMNMDHACKKNMDHFTKAEQACEDVNKAVSTVWAELLEQAAKERGRVIRLESENARLRKSVGELGRRLKNSNRLMQNGEVQNHSAEK